jgi:hypothetical protein
LRQAIARFLTLSSAEKGRTIEATLCLLIVRIAFGLLPFAWGLKLLGISPGDRAHGRVAAAEADDVARAIARAARHVPFRAVCLQQAFAALVMLRRRGLAATVNLGLARAPGGGYLQAHAWTSCGHVPVTGDSGEVAARGFAAVATFAA